MTKVDPPKRAVTTPKAHGSTAEPAVAVQPRDIEQQVQRVRRLARRLFDISNCIVTFGDAAATFPVAERSMASIEAAFCDSLPIPNTPMIATDTRNEKWIAQHRHVVGAPYIRFYAAQPIRNEVGTPIGSVTLIDYSPHPFNDEDRLLLADLGNLIERELRMSDLNASQSDLVKKNRNLRREALIDPVVGTWNRVAITRVLGTEMQRCAEEAKPLSIVMAELDAFKQVNDMHGQPAGDTLLLKYVSRLRSCLRPNDALGRYEGEKFMVVLPGASHAAVLEIAERMRDCVMAQPETVGNATVVLTLSVGTVSSDKFPSFTMEDLITQADLALNTARKAGQNRVVQAKPAVP